jgi:hypothetical protein
LSLFDYDRRTASVFKFELDELPLFVHIRHSDVFVLSALLCLELFCELAFINAVFIFQTEEFFVLFNVEEEPMNLYRPLRYKVNGVITIAIKAPVAVPVVLRSHPNFVFYAATACARDTLELRVVQAT